MQRLNKLIKKLNLNIESLRIQKQFQKYNFKRFKTNRQIQFSKNTLKKKN